jgi:hypothetical protein
MAYVKLDTSILNSTIWHDQDARIVFLTALLMAYPEEIREPLPQIEVRSLEPTGWTVPPGWYGFVPSAGIGIVDHAGIPQEEGFAALERLGAPDQSSRSPEFEGRRLIRVSGGYILLNYVAYREKDHGAADRMRRYRERKKKALDTVMP